MKKHIFLSLACLLFVLAGTIPNFAQTPTTGQIAGTVADPSGAVVPGATVTLTGDSGVPRTGKTDGTGYYAFPLLAPGRYTVEINNSGFAAQKLTGVLVSITETTTLNISLKLKGAAAESVEVSAEPPLVQSDSATTGRVIEQATIRQLPLPTRNFQQLLTLTPGTTANLANSSELGRGDAVISVNGQRTTSNAVIVNGIDAAAIGTGATTNLAVPATDTMQEFIVQTSLYDATTGRSAGGQIAAVTKSGTNRWHGGAYEFFRNKALNANNFFLKRDNIERPDYKRNQFGGLLGGPIVKDKLFFFVSYQGTRETNGTSLLNSLSKVQVPSCLTDDRSDAAIALLAAPTALGGCGIGYYGVPDAVAREVLQATYQDGNTTKYMIPSAANYVAGSKVGQFVTVPTISKFQEDQFNGNLDYQAGKNNRLYGKFFWADNPSTQGLYSFAGTQNALQAPGAPTDVNLKNRVLSIGDIHIFSPNLINDFRFGFNILTVDSIPHNEYTSAQWGIANPLASLFPAAPTVSISNNIDVNSSPLASNFSQNKTYALYDMMTWTKGRHSIKFGGDYKRQMANLRFDAYSSGQLMYTNYDYFMSGIPTLSIIGSGDPYREIRANDFSFFFQDDWRVSDRLTLNLGVRWDLPGPFTETQGRFVAFDSALAAKTPIPGLPCTSTSCYYAITAGLVQAGNGNLDGIPKVSNGLVDRDMNNFAPRIGFSFKPFANNDTIVVRGGYGLYYDRMNSRLYNSQVFNPPYYLVGLNFVGTGFINPANPYVQVPMPDQFPVSFSNAAMFPYGGPPFLLPVPKLTAPTAVSLVPMNGIYPDIHNFVTPYVQQYNLGVQWEAAKNTLIDIAYVGSSSRKLTRLRNINQIAQPNLLSGELGQYSIGLANYMTAPLGTFVQQTSAAAGYNSLQTSITRRYSNGLQFLASYTWSHSIDDYSGGAVNDLIGLPGDTWHDYYASSDFDRRHRFVLNGVYDLPKAYKGGNAFVKGVLNNWEIAGIMTWQSGTPFSIVTDYTAFYSGFGQFVPGRTVGDSTYSGNVFDRLDGYFDTSAFTVPTGDGNWGDVPRNAYRGPSQSNVDFSVVKFFPIKESQKLEFRTEFFNIFNHTNFANPVSVHGNSAVANSSFGKIVATSTGPRVIQFALKYSF